MQLLNIKKIAFASAFVAGNLFAVSAHAQSLVTGFPIARGGSTASGTVLTASGGIIDAHSNSFAITANTNYQLEFTKVGMNSVTFKLSTTNTGSSGVQIAQSTAGTSTISILASSLVSVVGSTTYLYVFAQGGNGTVEVNSFIVAGSSGGGSGSGGGSSAVNLAPNAYALRSVYNIQSAALNAGLSYDCNVFDKEGICLSTGGRYSTTNSPQTTTTSGLLIGSYKYDKNFRLGAWVDQNLSTSNADGIKLSNNAPLFGVFGVWAERNDGLGYEVKVSAGYGDKDVTVTRTSTNEGTSKINSRGIQSVSTYGIALDANWVAAPYVGVKYLSVSRGAYTETGSSALIYNNLRQETMSAVAGVKFTGKIDPKTFTVFSAGIEQDLNHNVGQYSATSGDTAEFNSNVQKTRPVVSAGVYYDIDKTQRVGLNAIHRQEVFQSTATTSALASYTVGF